MPSHRVSGQVTRLRKARALQTGQWPGDTVGSPADYYPAEEESRAQAVKATQELVNQAFAPAAPAAPVTVRALSGLAADVLINASQGADLLVAGARGAGGFARLVMGSVSTQVTHHALSPGVVVPGNRRTEGRAGRLGGGRLG